MQLCSWDWNNTKLGNQNVFFQQYLLKAFSNFPPKVRGGEGIDEFIWYKHNWVLHVIPNACNLKTAPYIHQCGKVVIIFCHKEASTLSKCTYNDAIWQDIGRKNIYISIFSIFVKLTTWYSLFQPPSYLMFAFVFIQYWSDFSQRCFIVHSDTSSYRPPLTSLSNRDPINRTESSLILPELSGTDKCS